jgi:hypothetical protein
MRIGPIADKHVGIGHRLLGYVSVQIEAYGNGNIVTDRPANTGKQLPFTVIDMLSHHGPMQIEKDAVERQACNETTLGRTLAPCGLHHHAYRRTVG